MRVLFAVGREAEYARNEVLLRAFRRFAEVDAVAPSAARSHFFDSALLSSKALRHLTANRYDLVFIGFYGYLLMRALRPFIRSPLLFDAFVSNFDTLCCDRQWFSPKSLPGRAAYWLDRATCQQADHVLLDTHAHVSYFVKTFSLPAQHFSPVPVGCNDEIFLPGRFSPSASGATTVLYYCTYLPLHGVDVVLQAAALLRDWPISFRLIGQGPLAAQMTALAAKLRLTNVHFLPAMPAHQIVHELHGADVALGGHFGASAKAQHTIPGKIYQMLAAQRPVIAADSPANRELLVHGDSALLAPPADAAALAGAVLHLHLDPHLRCQIAQHGRQRYLSRASEQVITRQLRAIVDQTFSNWAASNSSR